ncbi:MAG: ribose 5-phosphate isomerase A [Lachnospiraceae bacterium]|jgi:ribose 5-phosphate isomerase A|nr:ribose 5-phosphate isomerase A [Lachnospiraceae bacterium]MCI8874317.1 ribose 5-phosphate isomerase A [Lachnospiraceae bacterium]MCI9059261.1 ribose 5-phosphate isomerase A [Lachnospiraceae bacterium]GFI33151.1 ribose-5-phosphate isomerase A [Lachnospiraceae bacterium]
MKKKCAQKALEMIENGMIVGLGGGSTVALLIEEIEKHRKRIQAVTPSRDTLRLCIQHHIPVLPLELTEETDLAFDGCDELDAELNALKSCGGIHTQEKIAACMAKEYVLLADEGKYHETLTFSYPVTVEVLPPAYACVKKCLEQMGAVVTERRSAQKAGVLVSDYGNYLLEAKFSSVENIGELSLKLDQVPGLTGHSLFYRIASKAIIAGSDGMEIIKSEQPGFRRKEIRRKTNAEI